MNCGNTKPVPVSYACENVPGLKFKPSLIFAITGRASVNMWPLKYNTHNRRSNMHDLLGVLNVTPHSVFGHITLGHSKYVLRRTAYQTTILPSCSSEILPRTVGLRFQHIQLALSRKYPALDDPGSRQHSTAQFTLLQQYLHKLLNARTISNASALRFFQRRAHGPLYVCYFGVKWHILLSRCRVCGLRHTNFI